MELSHIIALAIAGAILMFVIGIAARLSIFVALGGAVYLWWYIIAVESTGTLWLMAIGATVAFFLLSAFFTSSNRH